MPEQLKIIHFSDIHIWQASPLWSDFFYPKRILGGLNLLLHRRQKFPPELGRAVLNDILKQEADLVIFSGDMTTASHPAEFQKCAELFAPIREKWGERFFAIPGNHDRYSPRSIAAQWYESSFPYAKMEDGICIQTLQTPNHSHITLVGIDASRAFCFRSNGEFTSHLADRLTDILDTQQKLGNEVILVGHYPVYYPEEVAQQGHHILLHKEKLQQILETYKPTLYLHGHKHQRWVLGNSVNSGSCGMLSENPAQQAGYVVIDYQGGKRSITARYMSLDEDKKMLQQTLEHST